MNVAITDENGLAWKLVYIIHGLSPDSQALLKIFSYTRPENAFNLIDLDEQWYKRGFASIQAVSEAPEDTCRLKYVLWSAVSVVEYDVGFLVDEKVKVCQTDRCTLRNSRLESSSEDNEVHRW